VTAAKERHASHAEPRALIVKLGSIGDVVMAIPAAYALHRKGYAIDWISGDVVAPVLRLYPWINVIEADEKALLRGGSVARLRAMLALSRRLAGRKYAVCATLYYDRRYALLTTGVRANRKVMLSRTDRRFALLPGRHHIDEYARILLGREDSETPFQLPPVRASGLPEPPLARDRSRPRVVIAPAGAKNMMRDDALRRWPVANYVELTRQLLAQGAEVVLAGGPDDAWASPAFAGSDVVDLIAKLSLVQTLALMQSAEVTVTHDTGPLHMAGITSTAIVTIFGPTDPHGRLPQRENAVALWGGEGFACRPCYDGRDFAPCTNNGCVQQISPAMVVAEVERMLEAKRTGASLLPRVIVPEHTPLVQVEGAR
jgi:heptosyltransferase-2